MKNLNFMKRTLMASVLLFSLKANALTIPNGSTITLSNINMSEDVIVQSGGTLIINGNITFGNPLNTDVYGIYVDDGGEVFSSAGSCTGLVIGGTTRDWQGFVVQPTLAGSPTTTEALHLHNFTIKNALRAIELPGKNGFARNFVSRELNIYNTIFEDNGYHVYAGTSGFSTGVSGFSSYNRDNGVNSLRFIQCNFLESSDAWTIWITSHRNVLFDACYFNLGIAAQFHLHFASLRDANIANNTFDDIAITGIVYHGNSHDVDMTNNEFTLSSHYPADFAAIGIGYNTLGGAIYGGSIIGNSISAPAGSPSKYGVICGFTNSIGQSGTHGSLDDFTIRDNNFYNLSTGLGLYNSETGSPYVGVRKNNFYDCTSALHVDKNASNTQITCNTFINGATGFKITDDFGSSSVVDWYSQDPNNQFIGTGTLCIDNQSSNTFKFSTHATNPAPPYSFSGSVLGYSASTINGCGKSMASSSGKGYTKTTSTEVFPNPTSGSFRLIGNVDSWSTIQIINSTGMIVHEGDVHSHDFDLSTETNGVYIIKLINNEKVLVKRIVKSSGL